MPNLKENSARKKVAVVTGGARGIGKAIIERLIDDGYFVYFTYLNSSQLAKELEIAHEGQCKGAKVDGSNDVCVEKFIASIEECDDIHVLVNNAGISSEELVVNSNWNRFEDVIKTNLGSVYLFSSIVAKYMMKRKFGDIVNISSQANVNIRNGNSIYGTSKAAIDRFSLSLAKEMARFNVAVNVVAPSFVETDMIEESLSKEMRRSLLKDIPTRKFLSPKDVANAVMLFVKRETSLFGVLLPVGGATHI